MIRLSPISKHWLLGLSLAVLSMPLAHAAEAQPDIQKKMTEFGVEKNLTKAEVDNAVTVLTKLVKEGVPVDHALAVVKTALSEGRRGQQVADVARSFGNAAKTGQDAKELAQITRIGIKKGLDSGAINSLLGKTGEAVNAGASVHEARHVIKQALERGGVSAAEEALASFKGLVAQGMDEHEARKAVIKVVKAKFGDADNDVDEPDEPDVDEPDDDDKTEVHKQRGKGQDRSGRRDGSERERMDRSGRRGGDRQELGKDVEKKLEEKRIERELEKDAKRGSKLEEKRQERRDRDDDRDRTRKDRDRSGSGSGSDSDSSGRGGN